MYSEHPMAGRSALRLLATAVLMVFLFSVLFPSAARGTALLPQDEGFLGEHAHWVVAHHGESLRVHKPRAQSRTSDADDGEPPFWALLHDAVVLSFVAYHPSVRAPPPASSRSAQILLPPLRAPPFA